MHSELIVCPYRPIIDPLYLILSNQGMFVYNIPYRLARALGLAAECAREQRYLAYKGHVGTQIKALIAEITKPLGYAVSIFRVPLIKLLN